jgi:hypothetical protein
MVASATLTMKASRIGRKAPARRTGSARHGGVDVFALPTPAGMGLGIAVVVFVMG